MHDLSKFQLGDSYATLAKAILAQCNKQFAVTTFERGEVLLQQGQKQQFGYLVLDGVLAAFHNSDSGEKKCKEFYFKDEFVLLFGNWLTKTPALYQIKVIKSARLIAVPLTKIAQPDWYELKLQLVSQQLLFKEAKEAFLLLNTPEQRYRYLLAQKPHWLAQLTLTEVAMYIGVSPISLSRIRKRLNLS
ncbi:MULTISPECIES: Crp/Fnr family transcriptional regulator [unclassified Pseudoalteromonas]|uniref:Crp/Fnr family transcriptional regulator n=1 Tax=unclassified Pseudoalteromonas TaxID=194690 RepID=UPI0025B574E6|nr:MULTISPECIES: Crp/Fnr family transcriptional regulator [unclassified Pseudoalteromonas]MDN3379962.1 Crp/Fnr family transcriptional regulator [Pseudoalteromonas sp. APC 3893]MDN3388301.1 Crp/Fnr family transcriptional regulator [Pseudoalteromonas sp. APC 4017]